MADIFQALNQLKREINSINGTALVEDRKGLNNTEQSAQLFINRKLLPKGAKIDDIFPEDTAVADYSAHVLQAVWNIAHYASQGYGTALWNQKIITEAFRFLDESWVPKIVDDKTYQVGKALQTFLRQALTEEALSNVPALGGVRDGVKNSLTHLQTTLNHRLKVYEIHHPDKVREAVELIKFGVARRAEWWKAADQLAQKTSPLGYWKFFERELNSDSTELEENLRVLDEYSSFFEDAVEDFRNYSKNWNEENVRRNLPDTVDASDYILSLTDEHVPVHQQVSELSEVYNSENYAVWTEKVGSLLKVIYTSTDKQIEVIETNHKQTIDLQREMLIARIADSKLLAAYEQTLQKAISTTEDIVIPKTIQSLIDNPELPVSDDVVFYNDLIKKLESHRGDLAKDQRLLEVQVSNFEADNPFPQLNEVTHQSAFTNARAEAKEQLTTKVEATKQQISLVNTLLERARVIETRLGDELAKQSEMGRKNKLEEAGGRIRETFKELHEKSRPKEVATKFQSQQFLERYPNAVVAVKKEYSPQISSLDETIGISQSQIQSKEHRLEVLKQQSLERKILLKQSHDVLVQYKKILEEEQGLYIPSKKIPKDMLIKYLECNESIAGFIDEMYKTEQTAASWYGFNRTNLYNQSSHYSSLLGPSDFDLDMNSIIVYVSEKMELIDQEMKVDVTSDIGPHASSKDYLIGTGNLWELQKEYQKTEQEKNELELEKQKNEHIHLKLTEAMKAELNSLESTKTAKEERAAQATLEEKINTIDHRQAMVAFSSYELEFRITDIEKAQQGLDDIVEALETKENKEALQYLESMSDKIAESNVDRMMNFRPNFRVQSGTELRNRIEGTLEALKVDLKKLRLEEQNSIGKSEMLRNKLERLEAEFKELQGKKVRLDSILTQLHEANAEKMKVLNEKKDTLTALNKLADLEDMLQIKYLEVSGTDVRPDNKSARDLLIEDIEQFKETHYGPLNDFKDHSNPLINSKHQSVSTIAQKLENLLVLLKLDRVQEDSDTLVKRFHSKNRTERNGLLEDIQEYKNRNRVFLTELKDSDSGEIQQKLELIKKNMRQFAVIKDILESRSASSIGFFSPVPDVKQEKQPSLETNPIDILGDKYFGAATGIFPQYQYDRAQQFWLKDLIRSIAAFTLGCFGYKTDAQEREEYLDELRQLFDEYKKDRTQANGESLLTEIEKGQQQFPPRANVGEEGYENSLSFKLESLKTSITPLLAPVNELESEAELRLE